MFKKISPNYQMSGSTGGIVTVASKRLNVNGVEKIERLLSDPKDVFPDLPSPENFSLKAQIDAGVRLDPVNSMLLNPSSRAVASASQTLETKLNENASENE